MDVKGYDIIGDTHCHTDELASSLLHLDYRASETGVRFKSWPVVFPGGFVDRIGYLWPQQKLLNSVIILLKNDHADTVMDTHGSSALAFHLEHRGKLLRPRNGELAPLVSNVVRWDYSVAKEVN